MAKYQTFDEKIQNLTQEFNNIRENFYVQMEFNLKDFIDFLKKEDSEEIKEILNDLLEFLDENNVSEEDVRTFLSDYVNLFETMSKEEQKEIINDLKLFIQGSAILVGLEDVISMNEVVKEETYVPTKNDSVFMIIL